MPLAKNTQTWIKRPQEDTFLDLLRRREMRVWSITGPGGAGKSRWSLQPNIERAEADGHPNVALLKTLARVINEEAGIEELETDADWRAA